MNLVKKDLLEHQELLDHREQEANPGQLERQENLDLLVNQVKEVDQESREQEDLLDNLEHPENRWSWTSWLTRLPWRAWFTWSTSKCHKNKISDDTGIETNESRNLTQRCC